VRTYRVARVTSFELLRERFARSDDFDLAAFWAESTAAFEQTIARVDVRLRIEPGQERLIASVLGSAVGATVRPVAADDRDGWVHIDLSFDLPDEAHFRLLGLGAVAEVLEPPELRDRLRAEAAAVLDRYRSSE